MGWYLRPTEFTTFECGPCGTFIPRVSEFDIVQVARDHQKYCVNRPRMTFWDFFKRNK